MTKRVKWVCSRCGSDQVLADACVSWNPDTQKAEVESIYDHGYCRVCDSEIRYVDEVEIP